MFSPRTTAVKLSIQEITEGTPVIGPAGRVVGVKTYLGQVNRVNIIATVVDQFESPTNSEETDQRNYATITLDDGTGVIRVKMWGEESKRLAQIQVSDLVRVIGEIRSFQDEIYINGEIVRCLDDPNWETVRFLELAMSRLAPHPLKPPIEQPIVELTPEQPAPEGVPPARPTPPVPRQMELAPGQWHTAEAAFKQQADEVDVPAISTELRRAILQTIEKYDSEGGARFEQILKAAGGASEEDVEQILIDLLSEGLVYEPEIHRYKKS